MSQRNGSRSPARTGRIPKPESGCRVAATLAQRPATAALRRYTSLGAARVAVAVSRRVDSRSRAASAAHRVATGPRPAPRRRDARRGSVDDPLTSHADRSGGVGQGSCVRSADERVLLSAVRRPREHQSAAYGAAWTSCSTQKTTYASPMTARPTSDAITATEVIRFACLS